MQSAARSRGLVLEILGESRDVLVPASREPHEDELLLVSGLQYVSESMRRLEGGDDPLAGGKGLERSEGVARRSRLV